MNVIKKKKIIKNLREQEQFRYISKLKPKQSRNELIKKLQIIENRQEQEDDEQWSRIRLQYITNSQYNNYQNIRTIWNLLCIVDSKDLWLNGDYLMFIYDTHSSFRFKIQQENELSHDEIINIIWGVLNKTLHQMNFTFIGDNGIVIKSYWERKKEAVNMDCNWRLHYNSIYIVKNLNMLPKCPACDGVVKEQYWPGIKCKHCQYFWHIYCIPKLLIKYQIPKWTSGDYQKRDYKYDDEKFICPCHKPYIKSFDKYYKNIAKYTYFCTLYLSKDKIYKLDTNIMKYININDCNTIHKYHILQKKNCKKFVILTSDQLHEMHIARRFNKLLFNPNDLNHDNWYKLDKKPITKFWNKSIGDAKIIKNHIINYHQQKKIPIDITVGYVKNGDYNINDDINVYINDPKFRGNNMKFGGETVTGIFSQNEKLSITWICCVLLLNTFNIFAKSWTCLKKIDNDSVFYNHYDFIKNRIKCWFGRGSYMHPTLGLFKHLTFGFYGSKLFGFTGIKDKWKKLKGKKPILSILPAFTMYGEQNYYYPKLLLILIQFVENRIKSIFGERYKNLNIDQLQANFYSHSGFIEPHFDFLDWFIDIFLLKLWTISCLHFGIKGLNGNFMLNWSYLFIMKPGELFIFNKWANTHFKHSLKSWCHNHDCMTLLFRTIRKPTTLYRMPTFQWKSTSNNNQKMNEEQYQQLIKQKPYKYTQKEIQFYLKQHHYPDARDCIYYKPLHDLQ